MSGPIVRSGPSGKIHRKLGQCFWRRQKATRRKTAAEKAAKEKGRTRQGKVDKKKK